MAFPLQVSRLTFSAPHRHWVSAPGGLWYSERWTLATAKEAIATGAWFTGGEDFASAADRIQAMRLPRGHS